MIGVASMRRLFRIITRIELIGVIFWTVILFWGEFWVTSNAISNCGWTTWEHWKADARPTRIVVLADPQIVDDNTYPGRPRALERATEMYSDIYLHRVWTGIATWLQPDAIIFLGDLFDGGREWKDNFKWEAEYNRFRRIFPDRNVPLYYVVGNHDIGIGTGVLSETVDRFEKFFGEANGVFELGNHSLVLLDSLSLMNREDQSINNKSRKLLQNLATEKPELPRVLFTHIPLFRPGDANCGSKREGSKSLPLTKGYQYQTALDQDLTSEILTSICPVVIFSGDDHDACEYTHEYLNPITSTLVYTQEFTVKSVSMAMGVWWPGFELISLWNPGQLDYTFQTKLCVLPSQYTIWMIYGISALLTIVTLAVVYLIAISRRPWQAIPDDSLMIRFLKTPVTREFFNIGLSALLIYSILIYYCMI
ncbi:Metallo-dependent phosphatase-like protein [Lipomyces oligophaga]|uniref:Metallo-dependent phosphatase-like protein n=1 Tax=Lipomyces oligophaga TaxID=45792 RepID=UPI0034CD2075